MARGQTLTATLVTAAALLGCGDGDGGAPDAVPPSPGHGVGTWDREIAGDRAEMRFGAGLSVGPDADGDGLADLLVGAPFSDMQDIAAGQVFLYSGHTGELIRSWTGEGGTDLYGACVALGPDVDGDGLGDVLVGAPNADLYNGHVYLYSGGTGELLDEWLGADRGRLGARCALGADVDGDGRGDIAFAEPAVRYDPLEEGDIVVERAGRVHVYSGGIGQPLWLLEPPERGMGNFGGLLSMGWPAPDGYEERILVGIQGGFGEPALASLVSTRTGSTLHEWTGEGDVFAMARLGPDATGDGVGDVATAWANEVQLWSGADGARLASLPFPDADYVGVAFGPDATGDDRADLVTTEWSRPGGADPLRVQLRAGPTGDIVGEWSPPTTGVAVASIGPDMDGDGLADFAVADYLAGDATQPRAGRVWVFLSATATGAREHSQQQRSQRVTR